MADLVVIYDPTLEMGAIVNLDERAAWGPAMIGPNAAQILQAFLDSMPFDPAELLPSQTVPLFESFLQRAAAAQPPTPATADGGALVAQGSAPVADPAVATTAQGAPTDEPPPPQPADTDSTVEADQGQAGEVTQTPMSGVAPTVPAEPEYTTCPLCTGLGVVQQGEGQPPQPCGMCNSTGRVPVIAQSAQ